MMVCKNCYLGMYIRVCYVLLYPGTEKATTDNSLEKDVDERQYTEGYDTSLALEKHQCA